MSDCDWDFLELAKGKVELKKQLESQAAQIKILKNALELIVLTKDSADPNGRWLSYYATRLRRIAHQALAEIEELKKR